MSLNPRHFRPGRWKGAEEREWTLSWGLCPDGNSGTYAKQQQHRLGGCVSSASPCRDDPLWTRRCHCLRLHVCLAARIMRFGSARLRGGNLQYIT